MNVNKRSNQGYEIIEGCTIGSKEIVIGHHRTAPNPYVYTVLPLAGADLSEQLREAVSHIHGKYQAAVHEENEGNNETDVIPADPLVKNYSFTLVNRNVYYRENSIMKKLDLSATAKSRVVGMIVLRDCVHQLINLQMNEYVSDDEIKAKQDALNRLYDAYTRKYGLINDRANRLAYSALQPKTCRFCAVLMLILLPCRSFKHTLA